MQPSDRRNRRYTLVRQLSSEGVIRLHQGHQAQPEGPTQSLLHPAYSSPHINQYANTNIFNNSCNNIYAEVENDYELDSGFTEDASDKKEDSLYTNSSNSSNGASYYHDSNQVRVTVPNN